MLPAKKQDSRTAVSTVAWFQEEMKGLADGLDAVQRRIAHRFGRSEPREQVMAYLRGLLSPLERKTGWQLAEEAGDMTPDRMQRLLYGAKWDADAVRDDLQDYVVEHFGDPDGVLVLDETGFLKKGNRSAGVQRQYTGTAGKIENCQIGVFLAYVTRRGRALIDRALYLPESWTGDPERLRRAKVPESVRFETKPAQGRAMLAHALSRGVPASWVTGDEVYGRDGKLRGFLEARRLGFALAIPSNYQMPCGSTPVTAAELAAELPASAWKRLRTGEGTKGPIESDWAVRRLDACKQEGFEACLLVRRTPGPRPEMTYYWAFGPTSTSLAKFAGVAVTRRQVEECFERAKTEVGLDQYEVRLWPGWHRHMTLAMFAVAYLDVVRAHLHGRHEAAAKGAPQARRRG